MVNAQLIEFIRLQSKLGASQDDIRQALASGTWSSVDIDEAFSMLKIPNTATVVPDPVSAPASAAINPPIEAPIAVSPQIETPNQAATLQQVATLQANVVVKKPLKIAKKHHWILWSVLFILLVIIIGSIAHNIISTSSAQEHERDLKRLADLQGLQVGLILYENSYGSYPAALTALVPQYVSLVETDPKTGAPYSYQVVGKTFQLCATMEESNPPLPSPLRSDQTFSSGQYCVSSST